ncbi:helix-turn-helix domain-containing protein [Sutterella sp.]|uniref:helix-turn-helix domain-containing protein n=1 Tax=Sutterella sp. TaxID=1981025 RepID=UPI0026E095A8|nr:helix-turn-helix domain-containing protein [Sutterella sp.]MDO5531675.1 helix-turn-helix domain-containing protein [Sutterella sp.]
MTERKRIGKETREAAIRLFEQGTGYKATASRLGIAAATVRDWKRAWVKGEFSAEYRRRVPLDAMEIRIVGELKRIDTPDKTIATMLGCSISLVQNTWRRIREERARAEAEKNVGGTGDTSEAG